MAASPTIPIVMWAINYDPIARGYVKSLVRSGGNITGAVSLQTELAAKQVELLTQALPGRTRLAILWDGAAYNNFGAAERQARSLHLDVQSLKLENPPYDFDAAFRTLAAGSPQMLLVLSSQFFALSRSHIAELAIQQRLPTMFIFKSYVAFQNPGDIGACLAIHVDVIWSVGDQCAVSCRYRKSVDCSEAILIRGVDHPSPLRVSEWAGLNYETRRAALFDRSHGIVQARHVFDPP